MYFCQFLRVCLLVPLGLAHGNRGTINRNTDSKFQMLISGGILPEYGEYVRHMVSIRTLNFIEFHGDNHFCTGSIVTSRTILTAAHCVTDRHKSIMNPRGILVVFGLMRRLESYKKEDTRRVNLIVVHPKYRRYVNYDVALLRLTDSIPGNMRKVRPISRRRHSNIAVGMKCITLGWGQVYPHGPYSDQLMFLEVIIREHEFCEDMDNFVAEATVCGEPHTEGRVCPGDLGGPLMCDDCLVGIIGGSQRCEGIDTLKFVNFSYVENWIFKTINALSSTDCIWLQHFLLLICFLTIV